MTQSLRVMPPVVYPGKFIFPLEKFNYFSLLEVPIVLGFLFKKKKIYTSKIYSSKFMDVQQIQWPSLALNNIRVFRRWLSTLFIIYEWIFVLIFTFHSMLNMLCALWTNFLCLHHPCYFYGFQVWSVHSWRHLARPCYNNSYMFNILTIL